MLNKVWLTNNLKRKLSELTKTAVAREKNCVVKLEQDARALKAGISLGEFGGAGEGGSGSKCKMAQRTVRW